MADNERLKRGSGEVLIITIIIFSVLSYFVFKWSYDLIRMGVKGEFEILAEYTGVTLYIYSISPGISLAIIMALIWIFAVPRILHPSNFGKKRK